MDGVEASESAKVSKGNDLKVSELKFTNSPAAKCNVGNGTLVEAYLDEDTNDVTIVAINTYVAEVNKVVAKTNSKDAYITLSELAAENGATSGLRAGAEGGCQAEVGSAAAMAAAALVQMLGGTPAQALDAASIALGNLLGLVCDPVGGLVEVPCQNRNSIGVGAAFSAAQLALSGIGSLVPFDEMARVMLEVGHALPASLRETARAGIAAAPSARRACAGCHACS